MHHFSTTPIGRRAVSAVRMGHDSDSGCPAPTCAIDKWSLLKDAVEAREALGVSDRDLAVLSALLSFHPHPELDNAQQLIVFPSNATLSARLHGMPESTLRRHVAMLLKAGLIARRDSPNGKRFARRGQDGQINRAFGFDLTPLHARAATIKAAAANARAAALEVRRLREDVGANLREASALLQRLSESLNEAARVRLAAALAAMQRCIRRKLMLDALYDLHAKSQSALHELHSHIQAETEEMAGNGSQNERHYQNTKPEESDSEPAEKGEEQRQRSESFPLDMLLAATPDVAAYSVHPIRSWKDLLDVSAFVAPMLGISTHVWSLARQRMGDDTAAAAVAFILQKSDHIRSPGAYLRALSEKAVAATLNVAGMIKTLAGATRGWRGVDSCQL
ncbi:plasmid replication protein RepC [Paracoccus beibuensis]|uniref:plasmid replication protein RepC n=1 Tax=Paracoccus beibuensis TaxID=547602 RepID=UPI00223FFD43|nr:plasmid replication protein RepC [Paracoccus beibuensis]